MAAVKSVRSFDKHWSPFEDCPACLFFHKCLSFFVLLLYVCVSPFEDCPACLLLHSISRSLFFCSMCVCLHLTIVRHVFYISISLSIFLCMCVCVCVCLRLLSLFLKARTPSVCGMCLVSLFLYIRVCVCVCDIKT